MDRTRPVPAAARRGRGVPAGPRSRRRPVPATGGTALVGELARRAPTWLLRGPSLIDDALRARLVGQSLGATPERMLREMVETISALAADTPLVLVLEDLHWSDLATLDLVSALARRRELAQLLLVGSYRPAEVIVQQHPLRALTLDLRLHAFGSELSLEFLSGDEVRTVLAARFGSDVAAAFGPLAYRWSDGNPLFLVAIGDHLLSSGLVERTSRGFVVGRPVGGATLEIPASLRQMVEKRIECLPKAERAVLEAASVVGVEFSTIAVAAALEHDPMEVEELLADLGRRAELVCSVGTEDRPDGSVANRLRFVHALYAEVLYDGIAPSQRAQLHRRIALGEERSHGAAASRVAAALALHYDRGRDHVQAVRHLRQAAENAAQRAAGREAVGFLNRAIALLPRFPAEERLPLELAMRERRGLLQHTVGDLEGASAELAALAEHARAHRRVDVEVRALIHRATVLFLLDRAASAEVFTRARAASRELPDPSLALHLQSLAAYNRLRARGFRPEDRALCSEAVRVLGKQDQRALLVAHYGRSAMFENVAGDYRAARNLAARGLALSVETGDLFDHLLSQYSHAWALLHLGGWGAMQRALCEEIELAERNDHPLWAALFRLQSAWLLIEAGAFARAEAACSAAIEVGREGRHGLSQGLGHMLRAAAHVGAGRPD
ncbi:MAG: hypothetical protein FJ148_23745, partial [Deltaproteobacteria bacterium]|nr:hypothetical protein [Deltaproteobacteria bacterium]